VYFYNKRARVVTEVNISSSKAHSLVMAWIRAIQGVARDQGLVLSENVELFLQPEESDEDACGYYFVDHASRTEFWLESLSSEDIGIPASASQAQLRMFSCHPILEYESELPLFCRLGFPGTLLDAC